MSKKSLNKKLRLGKKLKQNRRMPLLAMMKTRRRLEYNIFGRRNWRSRKLKMNTKHSDNR